MVEILAVVKGELVRRTVSDKTFQEVISDTSLRAKVPRGKLNAAIIGQAMAERKKNRHLSSRFVNYVKMIKI